MNSPTWVVYRSPRVTVSLLRVRPRVQGRWTGPSMLATSLECACRLIPVGAPTFLHRSVTS